MGKQSGNSVYFALFAFIIVVGITAILGYMYLRGDGETEQEEGQETSLVDDLEALSDVNSVSEESISEHDSGSDCWIAYEGKVFDVGSILNELANISEVDCGTEVKMGLSPEVVDKMMVYYITDQRTGESLGGTLDLAPND